MSEERRLRAALARHLPKRQLNEIAAVGRGGFRRLRHRGTLKVDWIFTFACAAYNLVRMRNLMRSTVPA